MARLLTIVCFLPFLLGCSLGPSGVESAAPAAPALSADVSTVKATGVQAETATGIDIDSAMPVGLGVLLGWQSWLSHRREVLRIEQQNGKGKA